MAQKVSIALCTYNAGKYLLPLIESLLAQTILPTEIVCCDDGSTDGTKQLLQQLQHQYPNSIKIHFNETNLGYIKNFEQCIKLCSNEFIAIADHDDIWLPQKIEKLLNGIGNSLLVCSDSIYMDADGNNMGKQISTRYNLVTHPDPRSFAFSNCVWGHTALLKRELLQYAFPIPDHAPYDIWLGFIAASVSSVAYVDEPLTFWRQHSHSYTAKNFGNESKPANQKYKDWQERLAWLQLLTASKHNRFNPFMQELSDKYESKKDEFSWGLFLYLIKYNKVLFLFWRKNLLSKIIECRKMSRKVEQ
ncbi:MAG: glycosyltransferase [Chitinophagaceae bacterium]|nr:glycosyltransferase [Chitinophagaceae bacterium]